MREIKKNKMYKHFKGENYFTLSISEPVDTINSIGKYKFIRVKHTETGELFDILINLETGKAIHNTKIYEEKLVIYRNAYENTDIIWARDLDMFAEKLSEEEYPEHAGKYRFEEQR